MSIKRLFIIIVFAVIIISIFTIITYKIIKKGNNISSLNSKSEEEIVSRLLKIKNYDSTMMVEIETNKNKTKYLIKQSLKDGIISRQEIIEPENIAGVVTEYDGNNLKISNNNMDLTTVYEDYSYIVDNSLWLNSFIEEYKKNGNCKMIVKDDSNEIILKVKKEDDKNYENKHENKQENVNKYNIYKQLVIDRNTGLPTKMIVQDVNQKTRIYILYNEIDIS